MTKPNLTVFHGCCGLTAFCKLAFFHGNRDFQLWHTAGVDSWVDG